MSQRDVTIYICDGCYAQATLPRGEAPRGFTRISLAREDKLLCTVRYGAVEWVAKFQRITMPPKVHKSDRGYGLRKQKEAS